MKNNKVIKIRIYKATDNKNACERFSIGHEDVLKSYNIKKVTSSSTKWHEDPDVYIIMIESQTGDQIYGGARFHLKNPHFLLPIEEAIGDLDPKIFDLTKGKNLNYKSGEMCGMWNTREMSGNGLSVLLMRVGIAKATIFIAEKHKIDSIYALCAPWTVKMVENLGFTIVSSLGNNGTFIYPTPELIASVHCLKDIETLNKAVSIEREGIFDLRKNPKQKKTESGPKGGLIEVEYDLIMNHEVRKYNNNKYLL
ncbi:MAG: hypothetical protein J5I47_09470 [Vicingus serpentipes]|nr:hypothetical protein [Vicingus serpentipes]